MGDTTGNIMRQFKDAYHKNDYSVELYPEHDPKHMYVEAPSVLAAFVAFCSGSPSAIERVAKVGPTSPPRHPRVFLRGCTDDYRYSVPSLFRCGDDGRQCLDEERKRRWKAYQLFLKRVECMLEGARWKREQNMGAVLQHYGIKTPWLDVVQNFYTAIWFATHCFPHQGSCHISTLSVKDWGWISFYVHKHTTGASKYLKVTDLPGDHSSRHLRPHAQQGASLAKQNDTETYCKRDQDLKEHKIAQVRFPNSPRWALCGYTFSAPFLFPSRAQDNSLEQLSRDEVQSALDEACTKNNLPLRTLGTVSHYI